MTDKPTRRIRGNSPPPTDDLPIQYWKRDDEEDNTGSVVDVFIALAIIIGCVAVIMFALGRWA